MNKIFSAMVCAGLATAASAADPVISNVSISGAYNRTYVVSFKLTGAPAIISLGAETNASGSVWLPLERDAFVGAYGDVNKVLEPSDEVRHIYWPVSSVDRVIAADKIRALVKAWKKDAPPDWMLLSLKKTERDLPNFTRLSFYESEKEIPNGWTSRCSKVEQIVFRKVPAKNVTWRMGTRGDPRTQGTKGYERYHTVTFTNDYYVSVFKVTQGQWSNVCACVGGPNHLWGGYRLQENGVRHTTDTENRETGDWPVLPCRAAPMYIRGDGANGINWPATGHEVYASRFIAAVRSASGVNLPFDLPTEAQWEYFCRAGTGTQYYDGSTSGTAINWIPYADNYQEVGKMKPNGWGLFDMGGNGNEWCLDAYDDFSSDDPALCGDGLVDPQGPTQEISIDPTYGTDNCNRVTRGSSVKWHTTFDFQRSASRNYQSSLYAACIRLVVPAEIP